MKARIPFAVLYVATMCALAACTGSIDTGPRMDTGVRLVDGGSPPSDGEVPTDAPTELDTSTPPIDTGTRIDTGPPPRDAGPALDPGTRTVTLTAGGRSRQVLLHVPSSFRAGNPAMVALHGNGGSPDNFLSTTGLRAMADANGVALALPAGIAGHAMGTDWDAYTTPASANIDAQLVFACHDYLTGGGADPARVYLFGFSQGGFMTFYMAITGSTRFAAAHFSAAGASRSDLASMAARPIPVDILIGTGDGLIGAARSARDGLTAAGHEVRYTELPGVGHCCPYSGRVDDIWMWLSARRL